MAFKKIVATLLLLLAAQVYGQPAVTCFDGGTYIADVNGSVTLKCRFTPNEGYLISWWFSETSDAPEERLFTADGKKVTPRNNVYLIGRRRIQIQKCQEKDTGTYVANIWTSTGSYRVIITLNVTRFPKVWVETPRISVEEGSELRVPCNGYKVEEPYTWSKLKGPVLEEGFTQDQNVLIIESVTLSAEGIWECRAKVKDGYRVDVLYLTVRFKPRITLDIFPLQHGENLAVNVTCSARANPNANTLDILQNGRPVSRGKVISLERFANFWLSKVIRNVTHGEVFQCIGENIVGKTIHSRSVDLRPSHILLEPGNLYICGEISYKFSWSVVSYVPILSQTTFRWSGADAGVMQEKVGTKANGSTETLRFSTVLRSLAPFSKYNVIVNVENKFGTTISEVLQFSTNGTEPCRRPEPNEATGIIDLLVVIDFLLILATIISGMLLLLVVAKEHHRHQHAMIIEARSIFKTDKQRSN